jgi:hypothetical protein
MLKVGDEKLLIKMWKRFYLTGLLICANVISVYPRMMIVQQAKVLSANETFKASIGWLNNFLKRKGLFHFE